MVELRAFWSIRLFGSAHWLLQQSSDHWTKSSDHWSECLDHWSNRVRITDLKVRIIDPNVWIIDLTEFGSLIQTFGLLIRKFGSLIQRKFGSLIRMFGSLIRMFGSLIILSDVCVLPQAGAAKRWYFEDKYFNKCYDKRHIGDGGWVVFSFGRGRVLSFFSLCCDSLVWGGVTSVVFFSVLW